jgi:hypothetical protein
MKLSTLPLLILVSLTLLVHRSIAQIDTIRLETNDLITAQLKPGMHQYVVYFDLARKDAMKMPSLWNRQVNIIDYKGEPAIEIIQHWYSGDTLNNRYVYSLSKKKNFEPIYHYTKAKESEAFNFEKSRISGSDTSANNSKKDFEISIAALTLNWELDLEIFSTLPFKKAGQTFVINFYHPGGRTAPAYYTYKVVGSESLKGINGTAIDCWQLKIDYSPTDWAIFWISKTSKDVVKMQEHFRGSYRYKVKLATSVEPVR